MSTTLSRRNLLAALLASAVWPAYAGAPLTSPRPLARKGLGTGAQALPPEALIKKAQLGGKLAYAVADASTGLLLESRNGDLPLPPASTTKTITASYALAHLGAAYRFRTQILAAGPVSGGRLDGDLILAGGGDPTLDTDQLGELARALKATGLREITGKFRVFSGALPFVREIDNDQLDHASYNPALCGLNLNFNRVHFEWKKVSTGYQVTMEARAKNFRPQVSMARMRIVDRKQPVYTYARRNSVDQWTVSRSALGRRGARWLPVRDPAAYAAEVFQTLARTHGIVLRKGIKTSSLPSGASVLAEVQSEPLAQMVRSMLKYSTNLTAEVLGLTATAARGSSPQSLAQSAASMSDWAREALGTGSSRFVDHSGLGEASRVTADDLARALVSIGPGGQVAGLIKTIPLRNEKNKIDRSHPIKVWAKTGTLDFVSALTGYMTAPDGTDLAFAIYAADLPRRRRSRSSDDEIPKGLRGWTRRSRRLQQDLVERWGALYGSG